MNGHRCACQRASFHAAVAVGADHLTVNIGKRHASKGVGDFRGSAYGGDLDVPVVVMHGQVALHVARIDASERSRNVPGRRI